MKQQCLIVYYTDKDGDKGIIKAEPKDKNNVNEEMDCVYLLSLVITNFKCVCLCTLMK